MVDVVVTDSEPVFQLRYSHHVIEHLGLKLYQNRPTNVLAELVSNGWDAGAEKVWIDLQTDFSADQNRFISVADNGSGMTAATIRDEYLVIGKLKDRSDAHLRPRYPTGRKGIGKLAPFGIAKVVDVISVSANSAIRTVTWLRLDLCDIVQRSFDTNPVVQSTYPPQTLADSLPLDQLDTQADKTGALTKFLGRIAEGSGTLLILTNLSLLRRISPEAIRNAMGRRFTVTLTRPDFHVFVNDEEVTEAQALPNFELRIPEYGVTTEKIGGHAVSFWVGFVEKADWPQDEAGVGVYAHGKIAQDRPFTFGLKGREIFTRYMYAVIEADWLDELPQDVVSTDRTSLDWEHPEAAALYDWGHGKVRAWVEQYRRFRKTGEGRKATLRIESGITKGDLPKISEDERTIIANLLSEVTVGLDKDEETANKVTSAVIKAYLHRPMREMLKSLWDRFSVLPAGSEAFLQTIEELGRRAVPESLSLAVVFAQRAYALTTLFEMQHKGTEPDLQKLIERFPWILQPDMERLTANQRLKTVVEEALKLGLSPSRFVPGEVDVNETYKPDFVFLSDAETRDIVVVEIKSPREDLTLRNREQLAAYMVYIEQRYPNARRQGYLVGANGSGMRRGRDDIKILSWDEVFRSSRRSHIDLLAAMLAGSSPESGDDRIVQVREFGGPDTWDLLRKIAQGDADLNDLLANSESLFE